MLKRQLIVAKRSIFLQEHIVCTNWKKEHAEYYVIGYLTDNIYICFKCQIVCISNPENPSNGQQVHRGS